MKRARMAGRNGKSFAQRMNNTKPITIPDSSDEYDSGSIQQGRGMIQSGISSLKPSHISESDTNNSSPLSHKPTRSDLGAKSLADEYHIGNPHLETEAEPEQPAASHSGKETSAGGSYAMRCLAAAEEDLNRSKLKHEEVTKRIEQDKIKQTKLAEEMSEISDFIGVVKKFDL